MIPIRLTLKNFMCYGDNVPPLHFDSFHLACLCGDNGHGKSALLDAITWALWKETRAKNEDDLIRQGEREMEVEFEFAVGPNRYRVLRKRTRGGLKRPGQPFLDFQVATAEGYSSISGNTIRETEQKIVETLRMDYQTFINSALLLQGRANEFSLKQPAQRKEVLATILGLSMYDDYATLAKGFSREKELQQQTLSGEIAAMQRELQQKPIYETDLSATQAAIMAGAAEADGKEAALAAMRQAVEALRLKDEQCREIARRIEQANKQLQYMDDLCSRHGSRIEAYKTTLSTYKENAADVRKRLNELADRERDLGRKRQQAGDLSNEIHLLRSTNARLKQEMDDLKEKIDLLGKGEAQCPLCGSDLGIEGRNRIMASYEAQGREKGSVYRSNHTEMQAKEEQSKALGQEVTKLEATIVSERTRYERREEALARERKEAEKSLPQEQQSLDRAQDAMAELRRTLQQDAGRRATLIKEIEGLPNAQRELVVAEKAYRDLRDKEHALRQRLGELQAKLEHCARIEKEIGNKSVALRTAGEEKGIYDELATAFGKRGVQALLIEKALPEIEEEANRLLGRMTDNRMSIAIESQRDTKKGDTLETLDIKIGDEVGTRNYEMFSGGEAFRINFALRIALSKLLARRAGAPLPTLIIDEGFGTQDSTGREKLVEAINSIQDDFEKILVITHIDELKDAFPVRIEVTKTEDGSTFCLS